MKRKIVILISTNTIKTDVMYLAMCDNHNKIIVYTLSWKGFIWNHFYKKLIKKTTTMFSFIIKYFLDVNKSVKRFYLYTLFCMHHSHQQQQIEIAKKLGRRQTLSWHWAFAIWKLFAFFLHSEKNIT